jgi:cytidylate kinase
MQRGVPATTDKEEIALAAKVVCISRTDAALGEEVGRLVAKGLGFQYVDEQVIERAARLAQVDPAVVAAVEKRQPLLRSLLSKLAVASELVEPAALTAGVPWFAMSPEPARDRATPDDLRALIQAAIHEIANNGSAVIAAHAASMTLASRLDVLRVLVTASVETRARRLTEARGITPAAASALIADGDRNRHNYFRRFHNVAAELPTHYDVVVNTDALDVQQAAEVIVCATMPPSRF